MKGSRAMGIVLATAAVLLLAGAALAGDKPAEPDGKAAKPPADAGRYEVIKYIDPFSPDPPRKPEPVRPVVKEEPKPVVKEKFLPDNLYFVGVTYDNGTGAMNAMIEVDGKGTVFLKPGEKVGVWEVAKVDMSGLLVKGKGEESRAIEVGTRFHDGITEEWRVKGGGSSSSPSSSGGSPSGSGASSSGSGASSSSSPAGAPTPKLDDDRRREIIERLRKRREAAKEAAGK